MLAATLTGLSIAGFGLQYASYASDRAVWVEQNDQSHRTQKILDAEQDKNILTVEQLTLALGGKIDTLITSIDNQNTRADARMKSLRELCRRGKLEAEGPDCQEVRQWESNKDG